ncbi:MAG: hypothetical protein NTZ07_02250 [Candidatus Woesebacteria bacterium]|nr:hypothetical protein [Candidatus Woesebacteria bacterium]
MSPENKFGFLRKLLKSGCSVTIGRADLTGQEDKQSIQTEVGQDPFLTPEQNASVAAGKEQDPEWD